MQFCADDLFDHARTNPVIAIGIFGAPCVKYLHRGGSCMHWNAQIFGQVQGNRQVLMHRVDMTACSFKFAINDFLKGVVHNAAARPRGGKYVIKHFTTDTCLGGQCGGLKRGGKLGSDQGLQTGLYRLTIPALVPTWWIEAETASNTGRARAITSSGAATIMVSVPPCAPETRPTLACRSNQCHCPAWPRQFQPPRAV